MTERAYSRRRGKWLSLRLRDSELEALRSAAQAADEWVSEFVREAIRLRVREILGMSTP